MKKPYFAIFCLLLALAGCGIKPGTVDAPPDSGGDSYPHTYPSPATDPAPQARP